MPTSDPALLAYLLFSIFLFLIVLPHASSLHEYYPIIKLKSFKRIDLPSSVLGPESLAFDIRGGGPYTGVSDGRILKWQGPVLGWADFAVTSALRDKEECDGSQSTSLESLCGRPLGLQFSEATGELYIADAYYGLVVVGPEGGVATQLATEAEGGPFRFSNGLDVDQGSGEVYFTDSSTRFERRDFREMLATGDSTGRLMKYDPRSQKVTVLLQGLSFPNGVALSEDKSFVLVTETTTCRVLRYWLEGPKAGTTDLFADLPGNPDNIKRNPRGEFWVPLNQVTRQYCKLSKWSLDILSFGDEPYYSIAPRLSKEGSVIEVLDQRFLISVSEVNEENGTLWIGSVIEPYVGVYNAQVSTEFKLKASLLSYG